MAELSVQDYVARQPGFGWRRSLLRGLIRTLGFRVLWNVEISGEENIPAQGGVIIMMNHISFIDPILCMGAANHRFIIPMTKAENMVNPVFGALINFWGAYSVQRGAVDRKALTNSIELLKSGQMILIAPEGHRQANGLAQPKDGLAYIATKADAIIVPTAIAGAQVWASKLKRLQRPKIRLRFGRAFRFRSTSSGRVSRDELAAMTDEAMYQLALALPDPAWRGVYSDVERATTDRLEFVCP